jgi:ADP-ribosyl-[dinitrogen reductase] hydrolase
MILEICIGDAYGAAFEFAPKEFVDEHNDGLHFATRISKHGSVMGGGKYTDDTQMTLAVAETIMSNPADFKPAIFAAGFLTAYKREVPYRKGYGSRVRLALTNSFSSTEFLANCIEPHSSSNGSVMRVLPCGILSTPEEVQNAAIAQSVATHLHADAIDASRVLALVAHSLIYNEDMKFARHVAWALKECNFRHDHPVVTKYKDYDSIPCDALITVGAAFDVVSKSKSYRDVLVKSIGKTGDVDSVAAIAMGLASLIPDIKKEFADGTLFDDLETSQFGRDYCIRQDNYLKQHIEKNKAALKAQQIETDLLATL